MKYNDYLNTINNIKTSEELKKLEMDVQKLPDDIKKEALINKLELKKKEINYVEPISIDTTSKKPVNKTALIICGAACFTALGVAVILSKADSKNMNTAYSVSSSIESTYSVSTGNDEYVKDVLKLSTTEY